MPDRQICVGDLNSQKPVHHTGLKNFSRHLVIIRRGPNPLCPFDKRDRFRSALWSCERPSVQQVRPAMTRFTSSALSAASSLLLASLLTVSLHAADQPSAYAH